MSLICEVDLIMSYILKQEKYDKPLLQCSENQGWLIKGSHTIFLPVGKQLWAITEPWDVRVKVNLEIKSYLHPKAEISSTTSPTRNCLPSF